MIRHLYLHIPFCARICPYCAFYKDLLDRSQTARFCEALLRDLDKQCAAFDISAKTIYFGGGTPTALTTSQLEFLLEGFHQRLDLSALEEWTIEANPGSVSARKAALLAKLKVNRISLGVQSWDDGLMKIISASAQARSPLSECGAGKILPITARMLTAFFPDNRQLARQKISIAR